MVVATWQGPPQSLCPRPMREKPDSGQILLRAVLPALPQRGRPLDSFSRPGLALGVVGGGGQLWGGCPGLAFPCSLRNVVEMDPYLGLFLIPQEFWRCLVFPRLSCCSRERSRTLGTVPGLVWREGHPSPTWGTKPEVQAFRLLCRRPMLLLESLGEEGSGCLPLKLPRGTWAP